MLTLLKAYRLLPGSNRNGPATTLFSRYRTQALWRLSHLHWRHSHPHQHDNPAHLSLRCFQSRCPMAREAFSYRARCSWDPCQLAIAWLHDDGHNAWTQTKQPELVKQEKDKFFGRIGYSDNLKGGTLFVCREAARWYAGQDMLVEEACGIF